MILILLAAILGGTAGFTVLLPYGFFLACGAAPLFGSLAACVAASALFVRRMIKSDNIAPVREASFTP
jgi:hypothetical protein